MNNWTLKPMGTGAILDRSIQFYRSNFQQLFLLTLIQYTPFLFLQYLFTYGYDQISFFPVYNPALSVDTFILRITGFQSSFSFSRLYQFTINILLYICVYPLLYTSVMFLIESVLSKKTLKTNKILKKTFDRFWPMVGSSFVYAIRIFGIYLLLSIVVFLFSKLIGLFDLRAPVFGNILTIIGFLFAFIGIAFFMIRWGFHLPIVTVQQEINGLGKSWLLTADNFWRLLAIFVFANVIPVAIVFVFKITFFIFSESSVIGLLIVLLASVLLAPVTMVAYAFTYCDLKARKEGSDLREMIEAKLPQPAAEAGEKMEIKAEG
jgi:hypothetical protein